MAKTNLIAAKQLGEILSLSKRQIFRLNSCGKIPKPLKICGSVRWVEAEIYEWIAAGAPNRAEWEIMKQNGGGKNND